MAKRFTDTDKWKKGWIRKLSPNLKLFWIYLLDDCNHAGIWDVDIEVACLRLGIKIEAEEAIKAFGDKIKVIDKGNKWFIPNFITFQYGELNPENRAHKSVLMLLEKESIRGLLRGFKGSTKGRKDKDKDMDKELVKDKDKGFTDFCTKITEDWNVLAAGYKNLPNIHILSSKRREHLQARFNEPAFVEGWPAILQAFRDCAWLRGDKSGSKGDNFKGGFDWIIVNDNNYIKVLEGKYKDDKKSGIDKYIVEE